MRFDAAVNLLSQSDKVRMPEAPLDWPIPANFPVSFGADGKVASTAGDWAFDFSAYGTINRIVRFFPETIGHQNADVFRQVVLWWLFRRNGLITASTLCNYAQLIKGVLQLCAENGILASNLFKHPRVAEKLCAWVAPSAAETTLMLLHELWEARETLGFVILDREGLRRFENSLPDYATRQTAYIPPRIWLYQLERLHVYLKEFEAHREGIKGLFEHCLRLYSDNYGTLARARHRSGPRGTQPFTATSNRGHLAKYAGTFYDAAASFEVADLLSRWLDRGTDRGSAHLGVNSFSKYLNLANLVGSAHILNFSGMRSAEGLSLEKGCLQVEKDPQFGDIYLLRGATTKTVRDSDALWVTSPSVELSVDVLTTVSDLRTSVTNRLLAELGRTATTHNQLLVLNGTEPWSKGPARIDISSPPRHMRLRYSSWQSFSRKLFDESELTIRKPDLELAKLINPTLDSDTFSVGKVWGLAFHQLRRTVTVNMTASGFVSDSSVQYQLKHVSRAQSLYYGQGYSMLALNKKEKQVYIRTTYEMLGMQAQQLTDEKYRSPLGAPGKAALLKTLDLDSKPDLLLEAKRGNVAIRETLLGLCLSRGPCPYGGIDDVHQCTSCSDALIDRTRVGRVRELGRVIQFRMDASPVDSPLTKSLLAQHQSIQKALDVIQD